MLRITYSILQSLAQYETSSDSVFQWKVRSSTSSKYKWMNVCVNVHEVLRCLVWCTGNFWPEQYLLYGEFGPKSNETDDLWSRVNYFSEKIAWSSEYHCGCGWNINLQYSAHKLWKNFPEGCYVNVKLIFLIIFLYPVAVDGGNTHQIMQHGNIHHTAFIWEENKGNSWIEHLIERSTPTFNRYLITPGKSGVKWCLSPPEDVSMLQYEAKFHNL